jgi:hypothetical protein
MSGDGQNGLAVALGVVESIQQMDSTRPRSRNADAQAAGVFRIAACRKRGGLLMPDLDESYFLLRDSESFEDAVDTIAGEAKDRIDAPIDQSRDQKVTDSLGHVSSRTTATIGQAPTQNSVTASSLVGAREVPPRAPDKRGDAVPAASFSTKNKREG